MERLAKFREVEAEDDIVCRFGPEFFRGARFGAGVGAISAACCGFYTFGLLKRDQVQCDAEAGFAVGVRNPDFPRSVLRRGFRTQPMLSIGCLCFGVTCAFKVAKFCLAYRRCLEFDADDIGFELLQGMSEENHQVPAMLQQMKESLSATSNEKMKEELARTFRAAGSGNTSWSLQSALRSQSTVECSRTPSFYDGVAVGLAGLILDCYLPQKPPSCYFNMHFGYG